MGSTYLPPGPLPTFRFCSFPAPISSLSFSSLPKFKFVRLFHSPKASGEKRGHKCKNLPFPPFDLRGTWASVGKKLERILAPPPEKFLSHVCRGGGGEKSARGAAKTGQESV